MKLGDLTVFERLSSQIVANIRTVIEFAPLAPDACLSYIQWKIKRMTTNVYCKAGGCLASDSRWSWKVNDRTYIYVDDSGFDKIEIIPGRAGFLFAGDSKVISDWKQWIYSGPTSFAAMPSPGGISVCIVDKVNRTFREFHGLDYLGDAWFAGTGNLHALGCWHSNKCAKKAIDTAKKADPFSGGSTLFFELDSGNRNLNPHGQKATLEDIKHAATTRGMVMIQANNPIIIPVDEAAAQNPEVAAALAKIASGEAHASAPCPGADKPWTENELDDLKGTLSSIFGFSS